ncbi:SCAM2 protein, partial [Polypterus senegalus]
MLLSMSKNPSPNINQQKADLACAETNPAQTTVPAQVNASQPAVLQPSVEPSAKAKVTAGQTNLLKQQEELERKAAELDRKERELQAKEVPISSSSLHTVTLFLNLLACLALFIVKPDKGVDFGLSILWFVLFTPCAFLCWYRPVYKAFSGWISALSVMNDNLAVTIIMIIVAIFFTTCAVLSIILLKTVHSKYRRTGASFQKAQEEFSHDVFSNRSFQRAASSAASSAAQGAFQGN